MYCFTKSMASASNSQSNTIKNQKKKRITCSSFIILVSPNIGLVKITKTLRVIKNRDVKALLIEVIKKISYVYLEKLILCNITS